MNWIFLILICGLPFGHFLFKSADLWHGQGHFFQVGLLVILCSSFFEKPRNIQVLNKPLGVFTLWAGLITSYWWVKVFTQTQNYPIKIFFPFFNWLCFIWFYKLCLEYLDKDKIEKILKWFKYSIIVLLFYCVLQYLNLDEFLKGLSGHDELVGTIGNSSHLAGYLAIIQPIYFEKGLINILSLILLWLIILLTGSASGVFVGVGVVLFWLFLSKKYQWFGLVSVLSMAGLGVMVVKFSNFFTSSHRIEIWQSVFEVFKKKAITGFGLGAFGVMKFQNLPDVSIWRHAHNEYFQVWFELGIIGLVLLLWCIWEYFKLFRTFKTDLTIKLASIFFGFCLLSLFTFNAHLWQVAIIGMISYSGIYVIKNNSGIQILGV